MNNINNVLWAQQLGGTFPDVGISIAADTLGNTYVTGAFNGTATFGNTTLTSTSFGYSDAFIAKFDSNKNVLWAQKLGGTLTDFGLGITVDEAGNSYATGSFSGTASFGSTTLTSAGNEDGFITKLDSSGNVLWAQKLGSMSSGSGIGITTDAIGNIYATGALNANLDINNSTSLSTSDTFIRKLDQNGNILWTKNLGGTSPDSSFGITNDKDGNTYVSGFFSTTATFDNITLTSVGNNDAFITKLDSSGNFLWAKNLSDDRGRGIIVDETGNAYFTGYFSDSAIFGSTTFSSAGNADAFVAKLNNNGNTLWARNLGGTESDEGYGIVADEVGNIYVSGIFSGTGTFGNTTLSSTGDSDTFIAKLDSNGNVLSAQKFGDVSTDLGTGIAGSITINNGGNLILISRDTVEQPKISLVLTPNSVAEDGSNNLIYTFTRDGDTTNPQKVNFNIGGNATFNTDYIIVATNTFTNINGILTFATPTVTINQTADNPQTVNFNIGSNATYNTDYTIVGTNTFTSFNGTVAFKAGDTTATVTIDPTADTRFEADETVSLTLASGTGYTIATSEAVTGEITNDDTQINLAVNNVLWAKQLGGTSYDVGWGITADASGNTYVMGDFSDTVTFGNTSLTSGAGNDSFIAKLDSSGNVLWAQKLGGSSYRTSSGITIDSSGNSYATGFFFAPATFGNITLTSAGLGDAFITKLDSSGNFLWAQQLGGTSYDIAMGIGVDSSGNSYVTGSFDDTATFGNITLTSTGDDDGFITKLDSRGNFLWAQQLGGTSYASGEAIASDGAGNTYVTGYFSDTATFGNTTLTSTGRGDGFITKLDSNGNFLWAQKLGDGSQGKGITIDSSGNTYVTGNIYVAGNFDESITKLDSSGKFIWAKKLDGNVSEVTGITVDNSGNIYVTGSFYDTATFGSITLISAGDGDEDAFIAKLDSNGKFLSAQNFGGTSDDRGLDITSDGKGNIYATGGFDNTATFDNTSLTSTGSIDTFVVKLRDEVEEPKITTLNGGNITISSSNLTLLKLRDEVEEPKITTLNGGNITISSSNLTLLSNDTVREPKITLALNNSDSVFNLGGAATPVQFVLKSASPGVVNEIGLFILDDDQGTIDGITPKDSNYTQAALARSRSIFSTLGNSPNGFDSNLTRTLDLDGGISFRLLLVQNGTLDGLRNGTISLSQLRLSSPTSLQVSDAGNSNFDLRFEDSPGSGQFNDAVVQMQLGTQADKPIGTALQDQQEGEVLDLRGLIGMQNATFTVNREAAYNNFVGFFRVADVKGGIDTNGDGIGDLLPGQAGYGEAAVKNRVGGIDLSVGNQGKATFTGQFEAGSVFAPFLIVNGTPEQLLDSNPNNNPAIYFPYLGANSDKVDHVRMLSNNVFGFEDLSNGGDQDFNDILVSVKFG
ncbi:SBBP repeat-containing protein [Nostoc sp. CHAB 5834]|nr:SBBP repeat-containing protein [Nostoc sp. CHAB 5834]